jgi:hypothetical protein
MEIEIRNALFLSMVKVPISFDAYWLMCTRLTPAEAERAIIPNVSARTNIPIPKSPVKKEGS